MKKESTKPNFPAMEEEVLKFWDTNKIFEKVKEKNKHTGKYFAFLDGPITANNEMKLHHAWNRSLKDIMLRYNALNGCDCHYQNGFDAQGLWVEVGVEKELGLKDKRDVLKYGMDKFTEACISRVKHFAGVISDQSKRLGQWMNWDNSYFTNSDTNITYIWYFLKKCYEKGMLIEKYRPMPWCSHCGTSLSEHELADSYKDMEHTAVFFHLPIKDTDMDMLVWTTTPWTLSSNVAIAVNPDLNYIVCEVKSSDRKIVLCKDAKKVLKDDIKSILKEVKGSELVGLTYETCFPELDEQKFEHKIVAWDMVDATEGSGAVHIAPGCGAEDFELGEKLGLPKVCPVDENGIFFKNFGFFSGKNTVEVADEVFAELKKRNKLYYTHKYTHRYPVCWRCKNPLIFRLSKEWYLKVDTVRDALIKSVDTVEWQPEFMKKRMLDWLTNMGDWNISRKRVYGLPLPFYRCEHCGKLTVVGSLDELKKLSSKSEVEALPHLHRPYIDDIKIKCPNCGEKVSRVAEVGDCWLDAGITPFSTKKYFEDKEFWKKNFPSDCVIEMKEQIRLWFYAQLFMSIVLEGVAPYKKVIGFAMLVAEDGSKFSKSGPNNISFNDLVKTTGADLIRYIFASNNMLNDTRFGMGICDENRRKILGLWNAYIFLNTYLNIDNPQIDGFMPKESDLDVTDKWLVQAVNTFIENSDENYKHQRFYNVTRDFEVLIDDITNFYIRANRRRFWKSEDNEDKLVAYWTLYHALKAVIGVMAPIMPFLAEHIWQNLVREVEKNSVESIFEDGWVRKLPFDFKEYDEYVKLVKSITSIGGRLRNENSLKVKQPLSKAYVLSENAKTLDTVRLFQDLIKDELNIKEMVVSDNISEFNDYYLGVNFKSAGAVLKGDVQKLKSTLENANEKEMAGYVEGYNKGKVEVLPWGVLDSSLFVKNSRPKSHFVVGKEDEITVVIDTTLTPELVNEGLLREIIRNAQILRKEADFNIEARVKLNITTNDKNIKKVLEDNSEKIKAEVLAVEYNTSKFDAEIEREVEIGDGAKVTISLKTV